MYERETARLRIVSVDWHRPCRCTLRMVVVMKYPMQHRIQIPQPYVRSEATDIRETFKAEYERLKAAAEFVPLKTRVTPLRSKQK